MVVALRKSVPGIIGRLSSSVNTTIVRERRVIALDEGSRPASGGTSRATSLESDVKFESSVNPAGVTVPTIIAKKSAMPRARSTSPGTSLLGLRRSKRACTPARLNAKMARKPRIPATMNALSIVFSRVMKPRSVSTRS